jgi:hypothetical protein
MKQVYAKHRYPSALCHAAYLCQWRKTLPKRNLKSVNSYFEELLVDLEYQQRKNFLNLNNESMSWTIKNDTLFANGEKEIGYFLPTANEIERKMIKNGDDLVDLLGEFVIAYDDGKTPLKSLFDSLTKIVDIKNNYQIPWTKTQEGELHNEKDQLIFIFVQQDSIFARIIKYLPEVYLCSQDLLNNLSSTNKHNIKKVYNRICDFYDKTKEN